MRSHILESVSEDKKAEKKEMCYDEEKSQIENRSRGKKQGKMIDLKKKRMKKKWLELVMAVALFLVAVPLEV